MASSVSKTRVLKGGGFLLEESSPAEVFTPEDISDEQRLFAATAEEFLRKEVLPREDEIYAKNWSVHRELMRKAGELGLLSIDIPEPYGGLGLDKVSSSIVGEQFALQSSFAGTQSTHVNIGTLPIVFFGTEAQKQKYLPRLATGEWIGAYALTEPQSGSDALAARTRAELSPDGRLYILNGQKMWITNGGFADLFTVFAKVDGQKFTAFLVERGPGLISGHEEKKLGMDGSSTTPLILEDCRVPADNVLGEIGRGHKIAFNVLNIGRLKLGARSVGSMKLSLGQAVEYAKQRHQFGQPISSFGLIKQKIAEMTLRAYVGEAILYRTAGMIDQALGNVDKTAPAQVLAVLEQYAIECSIIKVWESEALGYVVDEQVQIFGGYGYSKDYPAERAYRDARIARIYEGTNEINRIVIAGQLLRRAKSGDLSLLEMAEKVLSGELAFEAGNLPGLSGLFPDELKMLDGARSITVSVVGIVADAYGDRARDEQEALGMIAEMVIDVYAMESVLLRTEKLIAARGAERVAAQMNIARLFARDALARIERAARVLIAETSSDQVSIELIDRLARRAPIKSIAARRQVADAVIAAGKYCL